MNEPSSAARPQHPEIAVLGGGCFWCLEAVFAATDGVLSVRPGYCGGQVDAPSYHQVCSGHTGHAEVVRIEFDPARIAYRELLQILFTIHDPTTRDRQGHDVGSQYRSVIFATSPAQFDGAQALIAELVRARVWPQPIVTEVRREARFWPAEDEHHAYYASHGEQPYCRLVVAPKLAKFRQHFPARWRP